MSAEGSKNTSQIDQTSPFQMTENQTNNEELSGDEEEMEIINDYSSSSDSSNISKISDSSDYQIDDDSENEPIN